MATHNCPFCNQLVTEGDPYCAKCGGPQIYTKKEASSGLLGNLFGEAVKLQLDPWFFTAPIAKDRLRNDREARHSLVHTFRHDPDHAETRRIQEQINAVLQRREITDTGRYYACLPWGAVYKANKEVTIANTTVRRGQEFAYELSASRIPEGGKFERTIIVGDFRPADKLDYDDIDDEHHNEVDADH